MLEAQSTVDTRMPLRCAWYSLYDIQAHEQAGETGHLPLIYPMVIYSGRRAWRGPRRLSEMYGQPPPGLLNAAQVSPLEIQPHLIDLWRTDDEALKVGALGGLPLLALKYGRAPNLADHLRRWSKTLNAAWARPDRDAIFTALLEYLTRVNASHTLDDYREVLNDSITREAGGFMETWFTRRFEEGREAGREQGREEGREQGREEGLRKMLLAQLRLKFPDASVEHLTERLAQADEASLQRYGERILLASNVESIWG